MTHTRSASERKKMIGAGILGMLAIVLLWWTFVGFGTSSTKVSPTKVIDPKPSTSGRPNTNKNPVPPVVDLKGDLLDQLQPVNFEYSLPYVQEPKRNIFVYYEPPKPVEKPSIIQTPTPTPTPPVLLATVSPANVYARTGDFKLEVAGDKFTPQLKVFIDNNEMQTRYISPQQITATVPAAVIANAGSRLVILRSPDGAVYSNPAPLNVSAPPTPNYTYVGIIGTRRYIDIAMVQDKANKEVLNVQRGDLLGGRFRVTSISEKELVLVDNSLKIKHTLAFTAQGDRGATLQRPMPRTEGDDDEP